LGHFLKSLKNKQNVIFVFPISTISDLNFQEQPIHASYWLDRKPMANQRAHMAKHRSFFEISEKNKQNVLFGFPISTIPDQNIWPISAQHSKLPKTGQFKPHFEI
jgi:hypothetical protein